MAYPHTLRQPALINVGLRGGLRTESAFFEFHILDLFIEYRLQMPVIAGFLVMRFLSGYTLVYTVF